MTASAPARYLRFALAAMALVLLLLILFVNGSLAALAELLYPGGALWAHAGLLCLELAALFWFFKGLFRAKSHLLLAGDDSPAARQAFAAELVRRMKDNPHIRKAGITPSGPDDAQYPGRCLDLLNSMANEEISHNAKRIFLATALSQNGRIDALVMFVSLCRLVWRVSALYNQRPHPREVASLYWTVISSTFLSLSIEELDIPTEITVGFGEAFHAMAPAGMTASIPFAGKALQTFTASVIDGAGNCYLALRAGIITRNAYAYALNDDERPGRAAVFKEAGAALLSMSHEVVGKLAAALAASLGDAARGAGTRTVRAGRDMADAIGSGAGRLAGGAAQAGRGAAGTIGSGAGRLAGGAAQAGRGVAGAMRGAGSGLLRAGNRAGRTMQKAASGATAPARRIAGRLFGKLKK